MAHRAAQPVTAGLSRLAQLDRHERARIVRQLRHEYPAFRSMFRQAVVARAAAFASALLLGTSVMALAQGVNMWVVAGLVFAGMGGFCYVAVTLTNSRFDLLMAVLGAHRTDELHSKLITEQVYGEEIAQVERQPERPQQKVVPSHAVGSRLTGEPSSAH
ncbi:hypothetical protein EIL87_14215 [Saccharopolyspora rhizosphaerae]|uniref:Uncharacterized protein n=1 Tax=Saccharopolyspora rhizosphaerae TaxID=2492662 RepID=A0A426JSP9_9PSEU|nr:hypothetical protein [Saccharopolyspora rhizosphaerae]RRO16201.1 hypothetical protein EIL87_14215 [Saccharopolyspora rhizosphaerae]